MKIILLLLGFTCFGAGEDTEDTYKVPEGKPRIFFDGTKWKTVSHSSQQSTFPRARRRLPDLTKLFEMSDVDTTQEIQELEKDTKFNASVHHLISKIMEGLKSGLRKSNIKEAFTTQKTLRPYPLHLFDWLLTTTTTETSKKSYLDFLDATTVKNPDDMRTIDAADLWYGTEPTSKRNLFQTNIETTSSPTETTTRATIRKQMSSNFNGTATNHRKQFDQKIQQLYDLLTAYKVGFNRTAVLNEVHTRNETTPRSDNSQMQSQIEGLKNNRNKLIALILDLLSKLKVILAKQSNSDGLKNKNMDNKNVYDIKKYTVKEKEPMSARKVAQQADLLFSELSYNIDLASGDVLSDTEIIRDMEEIDVRNEKYMSRMFGLHNNDPKESINQKEIYDYSQFDDPVDRYIGEDYETRYKIFNRTERATF